jgi:sialate O-acetylesterase
MRHRLLLPALTLFLVAPSLRGDVKPHGLFTENMVLQHGMKVPVWGTADDGEKVTVRFQGQEVSAIAEGGKWMVRLDDLKAGGPFELTIAGKNEIKLKNVLVGEVWIASGQSNMEWPVSFSHNAQKAIEQSANPKIRLYTVPKHPSARPLHDVQANWVECGPATVPNFSAVAYFFGRDLQKARNVPVGLIHTSWGGTLAEAWTSRKTLEAYPELKGIADAEARLVADYPTQQDQFLKALKDYTSSAEKARAEGKLIAHGPPALPPHPGANPNGASNLYNGMIAPLLPFAIRGAIWYQGESNAGQAKQYQTLFPAMIKDWRKHWGEGDFPFLLVQLAPFMQIAHEPQESGWAELREAQLLTTLRVPNSAEAVITDVGEEFDIHPRKKEPVGARLALAARALAYGEQIEYSGPVYHGMKVEGERAILRFSHVDGGLVVRGDKLHGFTVAGPDGKFVNAEAEVQGDKVVVWSPKVSQPKAVRFGWANYPVVNLWNKAGLPASPFRTDGPLSPPQDTQEKQRNQP